MGNGRLSQILVIDVARFGCALLVLAFHYTSLFPLAVRATPQLFDPGFVLPAALARFSWFGWVGVEIFFVISGYVIALSAAQAGPGRFLRRRALRLVPAAWICATVVALVLLGGTAIPPAVLAERWMAAIAFLPRAMPIDPSYWTLSVELVFYLVVAACLREHDNAPRVERLALAIGAASLAFWLYVHATGMDQATALQTLPLTLSLLPHGVFFALGVLLQARRGRRPGWRDATIAILSGGALAEVAFHAGAMRGAVGIDPDPRVPMLVFAGAVAAIAAADRLQPLLARLGPARLAALGLVTYPLYLLHQTTGAALLALLVRSGVPGHGAIALTTALVLALAWWIARVAEPWLRARLVAAISARRAPAPDSRPIASPPAG